MIKLIFPPGCYGTFLSRCVFELTDLSGKSSIDFSKTSFGFDKNGSSHDFRLNTESNNYIRRGHLPTISYGPQDSVISLIPNRQHFLDYYDNQFIKEVHRQIVAYIKTMFSDEEIQQKLLDGWNYKEKLDDDTPNWILREWCSLWIDICLTNSYDIGMYSNLPAKVYINVEELFADLHQVLQIISKDLGLKLLATESEVSELQSKFVRAQSFHDIQLRCDLWVSKIIDEIDAPSPCQTLFDEAWVQHCLRVAGYEIQCDGLNNFPKSAMDLSKIIYKNDSNISIS